MGCSLYKDYLVEEFSSLAESSSAKGNDHFAIMPNPDTQIEKDNMQNYLTKMNISPIWYLKDEHGGHSYLYEIINHICTLSSDRTANNNSSVASIMQSRSYNGETVFSQTSGFILELSTLTLTFPCVPPINVLHSLKAIPRRGKMIRLDRNKLCSIKARTVYDHLMSLSYLADVIASLDVPGGISEQNNSELSRLIAYHEISEVLIGDIASYTADETNVGDGPWGYPNQERELAVNRFIRLYADRRQRASIDAINSKVKKPKDDLMIYFKALDRLDPIVSIWRYVYLYKETFATKKERDGFIDCMADFFVNPKLAAPIYQSAPFRVITPFLADQSNAKKYASGKSISMLLSNSKCKEAEAITYLIEEVPLFF